MSLQYCISVMSLQYCIRVMSLQYCIRVMSLQYCIRVMSLQYCISVYILVKCTIYIQYTGMLYSLICAVLTSHERGDYWPFLGHLAPAKNIHVASAVEVGRKHFVI